MANNCVIRLLITTPFLIILIISCREKSPSIDSKDHHSRYEAIRRIGEGNDPAETIKVIRHLQDEHPLVRSQAAKTLGGKRAFPEKVIPILIRLLQDPDSRVRSDAAWAIEMYQWNNTIPILLQSKAIESLDILLKDDNVYVLVNAINALGTFGGKASGSLCVITSMIRHSDESIQCGALNSTGKIGSTDNKIALEIVDILISSESFEVKESCGFALGRIAINCPMIDSALQDIVKSEGEQNQIEVLFAKKALIERRKRQ